MRKATKCQLAILAAAVPLFAGALTLEITNPAGNTEAQAKHLVLLARTTACSAPERTSITATAESVANGKRRSLALHVVPLSTAGTFGVAQEWPAEGKWAVRLVAHNPEYKNYATGALVPVTGATVDFAAAQRFFHEPTEAELASILAGKTENSSASLR
jgi:hypothetical protein